MDEWGSCMSVSKIEGEGFSGFRIPQAASPVKSYCLSPQQRIDLFSTGEGQLSARVISGKEVTVIPSHNIAGIRTQCLHDRLYLEAFLRDTYVVRRGGLSLEILPRLRGGDEEGELFKALIAAKRKGEVGKQIECLSRLSDLYIQKQELEKASLLLNAAYKLQVDAQSREALLSKMLRIEELFLEANGGKPTAELKTRIARHRKLLLEIREPCVKAVVSIKMMTLEPFDSEAICQGLTSGYKRLLKMLVEEAIACFGPPPTEWACVGTGSMARNEMCLYSDLEFAFVLKERTPEALAYFRRVAEFIRLQVGNLGETAFPIFAKENPENPSVTPNGFCMDKGGNTPCGVPGYYELIDTPERLARFVSEEWIKQNQILANVMSTVVYVAGNQGLVEQYEIEKNRVLNQKEHKQSNREILAYKLLQGHIVEFAPNLSIQKEHTGAFGAKKELYRPFQEILGCLSLLNCLTEKNSFRRIEELKGKNIFSDEDANKLNCAIQDTLFFA